MKKSGRCGLACVLIFVCGTATGWAQTTAEISGTVTDQSGAPVAGAVIKATQTATGAVRSALSLDSGSYSLRDLPIGPYMLEAAHPGFRTYAQTGIVLQVSSTPTVNVVLQVGDVTQTIDVKSDAANGGND